MSRAQLIGFILLVLVGGLGYWFTITKRPDLIFKPFTLVVLPDTQKYVANYPGIMYEQVQWILDNKNKLNIKFVSHMGDLVDHYKDVTREWDEISENLRLLEGVIPYSVIPGNHDVDRRMREDGLSTYDSYFPASRYQKYPWYKGNRKENQNNYQLITVETPKGPLDILFLNLEIEPSNNTMTWANEVVISHPNAYTIVTTHKYLSDTGELDHKREYSRTGNTGQNIWNNLVSQNCSIKMVLNGHYHQIDGEYTLVSKNSCDEPVYQIIQDYQAREEGGNGRLRYYTFDPVAKTIEAKTYSPHTDTFEEDADSKFNIPFLY